MERLIKRYQNRKLYDTMDKKYVNLNDIEKMIHSNDDVKIIDNVSGEDITRQVLIQLVMRGETAKDDRKMPMDGLKDMIQNSEGPFFQAFRGVMSFGKEVVQQFGPQDDKTDEDSSQPASPGQLAMLSELLKRGADKISDSAVKIVNGTLTREMLKVPSRKDWKRIEDKFEKLENKLSQLEGNGGRDNE